MDDHFGTSQLQLGDLTLPVTALHLCALPNLENAGDELGNPPTNHWQVFLEIDRTRSIMLDMCPGDGEDGRTGMIMVESQPYAVTPDYSASVTMRTERDVTGHAIVDLIVAKGRQRYRFREELEGCRHWMHVLTQDLESEGILGPGCASNAHQALSFYWKHPKGSGKEAREIRPGQFYE